MKNKRMALAITEKESQILQEDVPMQSRLVVVAAALSVLLGAGAEARQATPAASLSVDAEQCTIAPRPPAELRELSATGFEDAAAFVRERAGREATPFAGATPAAQTGGTDVLTGESVDAETRAAIEATIQQFAACTNAGDFIALMSTVDDRAAANFLGFGVLAFAQASTGNFDDPPAELDPAILDAFLAARAVPIPPPPAQRFNSLEVRDVVRLPDGRLLAEIAASIGTKGVNVETLPLEEEDGRVVIALGGDAEEESTPAVATPAA